MISFIKAILISVLALLGIGTLMFYLFQRQLIYFPDRSEPAFAPAKALGFEQVTLRTQDGLALNAWYHPATENHPTLIHFHGNAGNIGVRLYLAKYLVKMGYGILLFDYRGYGGNDGRPSEHGFYQDGESAVAFLKSKQLPENKMVFIGESIGSGVAVEIAKRHDGCSLILQSPFKSLPAIVRHHHPWLLIPPADRFNSIAKIADISTPVLILHGDLDTIVPFSHAEALYEKAKGPKQMIKYPYGNHVNLWTQDFFTQIDRFLQTHCMK